MELEEITALYHGHESAALAEEHFRMVFQRREMPQNIRNTRFPVV